MGGATSTARGRWGGARGITKVLRVARLVLHAGKLDFLLLQNGCEATPFLARRIHLVLAACCFLLRVVTKWLISGYVLRTPLSTSGLVRSGVSRTTL